MTTIAYKILDKYGEVRNFKRTSGNRLEIKLINESGGYITIKDVTEPLKGGVAIFDIRGLPDGSYTPIYTGRRTVSLEPFTKERGRITLPKTPESTIRHLLMRVDKAEGEIAKLQACVEELTELVKGSTIF